MHDTWCPAKWDTNASSGCSTNWTALLYFFNKVILLPWTTITLSATANKSKESVVTGLRLVPTCKKQSHAPKQTHDLLVNNRCTNSAKKFFFLCGSILLVCFQLCTNCTENFLETHSLAAWCSALNRDEAKMAIFATEDFARFVLVFTAHTQPKVLHAVNVDGQGKGVSTMTTRHDGELICTHTQKCKTQNTKIDNYIIQKEGDAKVN